MADIFSNGSDHGGTSDLLPGFAINWEQNQVRRQPHHHDLNQMHFGDWRVFHFDHRFHWSLFLTIRLTISQHWWHQAIIYLNQCWPRSDLQSCKLWVTNNRVQKVPYFILRWHKNMPLFGTTLNTGTCNQLQVHMYLGTHVSDLIVYKSCNLYKSGGRLNKKDGLTRYGDSHV